MSNDLWRTPNWLFRWLDERYGPFDVDLAASYENAKCARYYTQRDNALNIDWHLDSTLLYSARPAIAKPHTNGFCNPPYNDLPPWLWKAKHESQVYGFRSTFVLPVWNGDKHWRANVFEGAADEVIQIYGRVAFEDADGKPVKGNRGGTVIAHYPGLVNSRREVQPARLIHVDRDELIERYN